MKDATIPVLVETNDREGTIIRAPMVGLWSAPPRNGAVVEAGSPVGTLAQLRRRHFLVDPDGVSGRVAIEGRPHDARPVEYGQILFRLTPLASPEGGKGASRVASAPAPSGVLAVGSPTDGVFYRRPALDAKPYVEVGDRIKTGQPLGLIEVMKTFNPIGYGGAGLPDEAEVVEIVASDGQEVRAGQTLVMVKTL
jgi:biotin carboxyl carrier protein